LFLSGVIKSFKGFGVELETNLSEKIDVELIGAVESFPTPDLTKQSIQFLFDMSPKQKSKIERLQFEYGKRHYYDFDVVKAYIDDLNSLRYLEIIDRDGKFVSLLPAGKFKKSDNQKYAERGMENIDLLINSIEKENITSTFKDLITDSIKKEDTLLEAYKKFKISGQGKQLNGDQILPVVDSSDKMIGVTRKSKLTDKIAEQIVKSER